MKTSMICFLALILGLQVAAGLSLLERIKKAQKVKRDREYYVATEEEILDGLKSQIKDGLNKMNSVCPEGEDLPDCSSVESDINELMDRIYANQELESIEDELKSKAEEIRESLHSEGLSLEEIDCTFDSCLIANMYENNSIIPACDLSAICGSKRELRLREHLLQQHRRGPSGPSGDESEAGDKSAGSAEYGRTELDDIYGLCFLENSLKHCEDKDNEECSTILAHEMVAAMQRCFTQYHNNNDNNTNNDNNNENNTIKKKGIKQAIAEKLKRMVAEKEAKARREQVLRRLVKELDF